MLAAQLNRIARMIRHGSNKVAVDSSTGTTVTGALTSTGLVTASAGLTVVGTTTLPTGAITSAMILNGTIAAEDMGLAWTSFSPTLVDAAGGVPTQTSSTAFYIIMGKLGIVHASIAISGAGTCGGNSEIRMIIPSELTGTATGAHAVVGSGHYFDSGTASYIGMAFMPTTTRIAIMRTGNTSGIGVGNDPNITPAANDVMSISTIIRLA